MMKGKFIFHRAVIAVLVMGVLAGCEFSETQRQAELVKKPLPAQIADTVEIIHSEEGKVKLKIAAPKLVLHDVPDDQYNVFPEGVNIAFFDSEGERTADLTANYGMDYASKKERYVKDSVIILTSTGDKIETSELYMIESKDSIHNNGKYVRVTKPSGLMIQGYALVANMGFTSVRIADVFDSQIVIDEAEQPKKTLTQPLNPPQ